MRTVAFLVRAEGRVPDVGGHESQEELLIFRPRRAPLRAVGRSSRCRSVVISVAFAAACLAVIAALIAPRRGLGLASDSVSAVGDFLSGKAVENPSDMEAQAQELAKAADVAKAEFFKDRDAAAQAQQKINEKTAAGQKQVDDAAAQMKGVNDEKAQAQQHIQWEGQTSPQTQGMLDDAARKEKAALELDKQGKKQLADADAMRKDTEPIFSKEGQEAATAEGAVLQEKEILLKEAKYYKDLQESKQQETDDALKAAEIGLDAAGKAVHEADDRLQAAQKQSQEAQDREQKDYSDASHAVVTQQTAQQTELSSNAEKAQAKADLAIAEDLVKKAGVRQHGMDEKESKVAGLEKQAQAKTAAHRVCVDLPGTRLREPDGAADEFATLVLDKDVSSADKCKAWCQANEGCVQAIFSSGNSGCYLFNKVTNEVNEWNDEYTSTVCGDKSQEKAVQGIVSVANARKPVIPEIVQCSWSGEECASTKCCNEVACTWDFKACTGYSCYQNNGASSCQPTTGWAQGQIIGGFRNVRKVESGAEVTARHGTSLFCFMVVNPKAPEAAVAKNMEDKKLGIYQCDSSLVLTGWEVPKTPWMTYMNADAFSHIWQQVKDNGEYKKHDWVVKTEADSVFFPNMLRMHLGSLKVPRGVRAYVKNVNYGTQFQGAVEVFTTQAVQLYFDQSSACDRILKNDANSKAGEHFYIQACMNALGVDTLEDFMLLRDHMCGADCGAAEGPCSDGWVVAYHFYRDADAWNKCHDEASKAQLSAGHKPEDGGVVRDAVAPPPKVEELLAVVTGADAQAAAELRKQAEDEHNRLATDEAAAEKAMDDAANREKDAKNRISGAQTAIVDAKKDASEARKTEKESTEDIAAAKKAEAEAAKLVQTRLAELASANAADEAAKAELARQQSEEAVLAGYVKRAVDLETQARGEAASVRFCMDLPGVKLRGDSVMNITSIAEPVNTSTPEACREWCLQHSSCKQSAFSWSGRSCVAFSAFGAAQEFSPGHNSSLCGAFSEEATMKEEITKIYKTMPYVPPVRECAWAGEDCTKSQCCANVPVPNWQFTEFKWYTCYKQDQFFSGCYLGAAPSNWDGTVLGGAGTREVPKADEGVIIQGTSLFCFSVVMWHRPATQAFWDSEADLANNIRNTNRSIMRCDAHAWFEGSALGYGDASSINNIDSFIGAWNAVKTDGRYLQHDWTVKVDADAVFFPDRLRLHIQSLRTPQGSRVYLRNIPFKFQFLGAIEIFTKEAMQRYFEKADVCKEKVGHQGGEDYYMLSCLDGIGIDHQTDFAILNDKYAAMENCNDPWVVGFHFYKKVEEWNNCHDAAVNAAKNSGKDWWQNE